MPLTETVHTQSDLDFGAILEGLRLHPESYVNFGRYWWTLKRMIADWVDENGGEVDPNLIRGTFRPKYDYESEEHEVYNFLDQFSGRDDFMDWISFINPQTVWDDVQREDVMLEDPDWEENFL